MEIGENLGKESAHLGHGNGFCEVEIEAGLEAELFVFGEGIGGEGDEEGAGGLSLEGFEDFFGGGNAVHDGHLDVEEDEVVGEVASGVEGLEAVFDEGGMDAAAVEDELDDLAVVGVIFGDEDFEVAEFFCGPGLVFAT